MLGHADRAEVRRAVDSLVELAREQPEVQRALADSLVVASEEQRWPIAYVLGQLPDPPQLCLEVLTVALGSQDRDMRWATLQLLVSLGKKDERVPPLCLQLLKSENAVQRRMAVYCIRDLEIEDDSIRLQCLGDKDALVRVAAITSLSHQAPPGEEVRILLSRLSSEDTDSRVRNAAEHFIDHLNSSSKKASPETNKKKP